MLCLALPLVFALVLCSCAPEDIDLAYGVAPPVNTADPQLAETEGELLLTRNIFEGLYRLDAKGEPVPGAAECEVSSGGRVYTFTIREGAKWEDGTPLTADDFAFGLERALSPVTECPGAASLFGIVNAREFNEGRVGFSQVGVKVLSTGTLRVTLASPDPDFPRVLASAAASPCNREFFQSTNGRYGLDKSNVLGNGSFTLSLWDGQNGIVLRRSARYNGSFRGRVSSVTIAQYDDGERDAKLAAGRIDGCRLASVADLPAKGYTPQMFPVYACDFVFRADVDEALRDILVRAADFDAVRKALGAGYAPSLSVLPPSLGTIRVGVPGYDPAGAREDFLEYGKRSGKTSLKLLCPDDPALLDALRAVVGYWQNGLGLYSVSIDTAPTPEETLARFEEGGYDAALLDLTDKNGSAYDLLYPFSAGSPQNYLGREAGGFEEKLAALADDPSPAALAATVGELAADNLMVPVCSREKCFAFRDDYTTRFSMYGGETDFALIE